MIVIGEAVGRLGGGELSPTFAQEKTEREESLWKRIGRHGSP